MKELVNTQWIIHGESGWPLWLLIPMLLGALFATLRWLRAERRRRSVAAFFLPITATLFSLACVWLVWQPVLIRVQEWRHRARTLTYVDKSASMLTPLHGGSLSDALDLLAAWQPDVLPKERARTARDLEDVLRRASESAEVLRTDLTGLLAELEQGLPAGEKADVSLSSFARWAAELTGTVFPLLSAIEQAEPVQAAGGEVATQGEGTQAWLDQLSKMAGQLSQYSETPKLEAAGGIVDVLRSFDSLAAAGTPLLERKQLAMDTALCAANETLTRAVEDLARVTRLDVAHRLAAGLGVDTNAAPAGSAFAEETDIYGSIAGLLDAHQDDVISDVFVFSDGGHNGPDDAAVAPRLKRSGIRLRAVGIGAESREKDYAIVDWQAPALVRTKTAVKIAVKLKVPVRSDAPVELAVSSDGNRLVAVRIAPSLSPTVTETLTFDAPDEGRHTMSLAVDVKDANPANNQAVFSLQVLKTVPRSLLIGDMPDWDTVYLNIAMQIAGLENRQLFHGVTDEPLKRGGSSGVIPRTVSHWARNRIVVFAGSVFTGFDQEDVEALGRYVTEEGGTVILLVSPGSDYLARFASTFNWQGGGSTLEDSSLRLAEPSYHLPMMRIAVDGPRSARDFARFGECGQACMVPPQHIVLLENRHAQPVLSLGFYGRGRVYLCGLTGLSRLAGFSSAPLLDRFLVQWMSDAAAALFDDESRTFACYPPAPVVGRRNLLVKTGEPPLIRHSGDTAGPVTMNQGIGNQWAVFVPTAGQTLELSCGGYRSPVTPVDNPGMERIYYEFNADFLRRLAADAGGTYFPLVDADKALTAIAPVYWTGKTARRYVLADHWLLLLFAVAIGTLHWILRKLSGLAI